MQILYPFSGSIQQYIEGVEQRHEADRCRPVKCPQCSSRRKMVSHGFYRRTLVDIGWDGVIRVRRYLCRACRRTVSLLPEFVLPYLRFTLIVIGLFLTARLLDGQTLRAAAEAAHQTGMAHQRGQQWVRRFRHQAAGISAAMTALAPPIPAADFAVRAIQMLQTTGWVDAHRFLFEQLRFHLMGWPQFLTPAGIAVTIRHRVRRGGQSPQKTCMESESPPA